MTGVDRQRWDDRYARVDSTVEPSVPRHFANYADRLGSAATAIELVCGQGQATVWLASRGVDVVGYDISAVAIGEASALAERSGVADRCRFEVVDLDDGLPPGPPVDLVLCHLFRDERLDQSIVDRLEPGGLLAVAALSEVGAQPGRFRVRAGALVEAFSGLDLVSHTEADGVAALIAVKPDPTP